MSKYDIDHFKNEIDNLSNPLKLQKIDAEIEIFKSELINRQGFNKTKNDRINDYLWQSKEELIKEHINRLFLLKEDIINQNTNNIEKSKSLPKILITSKTTDITRIFEFAKQSKIISEKTQTNQIIDIFFTEKGKFLRQNYDKNKSNLIGEFPAEAGTESFYEFTKLCSANLPSKKRELLIRFLNELKE
jgi:hypothetical protein